MNINETIKRLHTEMIEKLADELFNWAKAEQESPDFLFKGLEESDETLRTTSRAQAAIAIRHYFQEVEEHTHDYMGSVN